MNFNIFDTDDEFFDDDYELFESDTINAPTLTKEISQIISTANKYNYNPNIISFLTKYLSNNLGQNNKQSCQIHFSQSPTSNTENLLVTLKDSTFSFNFDKDFIFFSKLNNDINDKNMISKIFPHKAGDSTSIFELNGINTKDNNLFTTAITFDNLDFENCAFIRQPKDCYKILNNGNTSYYGNLDLSSILYTEPISILFDSHSRIYNLISGSIEYEEYKFINEVKNFGLQQTDQISPDYFAFE